MSALPWHAAQKGRPVVLQVRLWCNCSGSQICCAACTRTGRLSHSHRLLTLMSPLLTLQVGLHFMNPVPVMRLVEVIRGMHTSDEVSLECCP